MDTSRIPPARFSTDDLPIRDRLPIWCDVFGRMLFNVDFDPIPGRDFRQAGSLVALGNLGIATGETNGFLSWRERPRLADSNDDLVLHTNLTGYSLPSQMGEELRLARGEAALLSCAESHAHHFPEAARALSVRIPRRTLGSLVRNPEAALMRRVAANTPALRLLTGYITAIVGQNEPLSSDLQQSFGTHISDLVALIVGATRDGTELARTRGGRAARLHSLKTDIISHLGNEGLSVVEVARRHGVTARYVQMLFEGDGGTFTEFVIEQRLARAHQMLIDPNAIGRTISSIAFEVGFANLSYFNRVFRRRYGGSPSEVRAAAMRGG
jgi:AraC-like DNA-binding protein